MMTDDDFRRAFEAASRIATRAMLAGWVEWREQVLSELEGSGLTLDEAEAQLSAECPPELQTQILADRIDQLRRMILDPAAPVRMQ